MIERRLRYSSSAFRLKGVLKHRRKGATSHIIDMVWLYRSYILVGERGPFTCCFLFWGTMRTRRMGQHPVTYCIHTRHRYTSTPTTSFPSPSCFAFVSWYTLKGKTKREERLLAKADEEDGGDGANFKQKTTKKLLCYYFLLNGGAPLRVSPPYTQGSKQSMLYKLSL